MKCGSLAALVVVAADLLGGGPGVPEAHAQVEVWNRRYPASPPAGNLSDYGVGVQYAQNFGWVAGLKAQNSTSSCYQAIKYDPDPSAANGGIVASVTWPSVTSRAQRTAKAMAVGQTTSGVVLVLTGTVIKTGSPSTQDIVTVAFDQNLQLKWSATYDNTALDGDDISVGVGADGLHAVVVGTSAGLGTGADIVTLVYNIDDGSPVGTPQRFNTSSSWDDTAAGVAMDEDTPSRFYVGGTTYATGGGTGLVFRAIAYDINDALHKVDQAWTNTYGVANRDCRAAAVAANPKTNAFYITGSDSAIATDTGDANYLTVRFSKADGTVQWAIEYDGPTHGNDAATAIGAQAISGYIGHPAQYYVYVTGVSPGSGTTSDMVTIRYSDQFELGGSILVNQDWFARYHRVVSPGFDDEGVALVSHAELPVEVFVTGASKSSSGDWDYVTAHYDGTIPTPPTSPKDPVWSWLSGLAGSGAHDIPASIAWTASFGPGPNNVFVTGRSFSSVSGDDFLTVRIDGQ